jgi:hypothetical protein
LQLAAARSEPIDGARGHGRRAQPDGVEGAPAI